MDRDHTAYKSARDPNIDKSTTGLGLFLGFAAAAAVVAAFWGYSAGGASLAVAGVAVGLAGAWMVARVAGWLIESLSWAMGGFFFMGRKVSYTLRERLAADVQVARTHKAHARWPQALEKIDEVLKKDPAFPEALYLKAEILWEGFQDARAACVPLRKLVSLGDRDDQYWKWGKSLHDKLTRVRPGQT
ncbi:MAG: tetratricopeptide repeat protein [Desulfatibacillaceae bacterium]